MTLFSLRSLLIRTVYVNALPVGLVHITVLPYDYRIISYTTYPFFELDLRYINYTIAGLTRDTKR